MSVAALIGQGRWMTIVVGRVCSLNGVRTTFAVLLTAGGLCAGSASAAEVNTVEIDSAPGADQAYAIGDRVEVSVGFDETVWTDPNANPEFRLQVGVDLRTMPFVDGSGSETLRFEYTVRSGDLDEDGVGYAADALQGGDLTDGDAQVADRSVVAVAGDAGHRVDGVLPNLLQLEVVSSPRSEDTYGAGEDIDIAAVFDERVRVVHAPDLTLALTVGTRRDAILHSGVGTTSLVFRYRVQDDDAAPDGIRVVRGGILDGRVTDMAGNEADLAGAELDPQSGHRVDAVPASASDIDIVSDPGSDDTYGQGDRIEVEVVFDKEISVSGAPELLLSIGSLSRAATLVRQRPTVLVFRYTVRPGDLDENGIAVAADALRGGTLQDAVGNPVERVLPPFADPGRHRVDAIQPSVAGVEITSDPGADDTYGLGDAIEVTVGFDEVVHVTSPCADGDPPELTLVLSVGANSRGSEFVGGSGSAALQFRYTVQAGDLDEDGISIGPAAMPGGCVRDSAGNPSPRRVPPVSAQSGHKVDAGGSEAPTVTSVRIASDPQTGSTYAEGEDIRVEIVFEKEVHVTGEPVLILSIGTNSRSAVFLSGSGTDTLTFQYTVQEGDLDDDGISIASDALREGTIEDNVGNAVVRTFQALRADPAHRVRALGPVPASVSIVSAPESGDAYGLGENIQVEITFTELVHVTGEPVLILSIGANSRSAGFVSGSGTAVLLFRYTVQAGDLDDDGISIATDALREGEITRATGGRVSTRLPALPAQGGHKVDGLVAPRVSSVEIVSLPESGGTYRAGEAIEVDIVFGEDVHVTGEPVLALSVGPNTRPAVFVSGSGTDTLTFRYVVQEGDVDEDGVSIAASALTGGVIASAGGDPVTRTFEAVPAQSGHKVDAPLPATVILAVRFTSTPADGDTYQADEPIEAAVTFDAEVHVTGQPVVTVSVGGESRDAAFVSGSGTDTLTFRYVVQEGDVDEDGVSIAASALTGGVIASAGGDPVTRTFEAVPAQSGHKVDAPLPATVILAVRFTSTPADGDTYQADEPIDVAVTFDAEVHVTGQPVVTVSVGGESRDAAFVSGSGTDTLMFRYVVQEGDVDEDGVSIAASALAGGVIASAGGDPVTRTFEAVPAQSAHKVDAPLPATVILAVRFTSTPADGDTYQADEPIEAAVTFDAEVHVTGQPVVTVSVGGESRAAAFVSGSGTDTLTFRYVVQEGDVDEDGVSIAASALTGGVIASASGDPVTRTFEAVPAQSAHKVDALRPVAVSVIIATTPAQGDTYRAGEHIEITVTFDEEVHVTGKPVLTVSVGQESRQASFVSGSGTQALTFRYAVRQGDLDEDGISIAANALTGGVIEDARGNTADRAFAAVAASDGHRVDATRSPAAGVTDVRISSRPETARTYTADEPVEVTVTFDRTVHVTGDPVLTISVGGRSRSAGFASGSGTLSLLFRYAIQADDVDEDGISIAANALTGGVIEDDDGRAVDRAFSAVAAQRDHRVGPEIVVNLEPLALSVDETWSADLAPVLEQVGADAFGVLRAFSDNPGVVTVRMADTVLTLTPVSEGAAAISVDATNVPLSLSFSVAVRTSAAEKAVITDALATVGRGLLWSAANTIGTRLAMDGREPGPRRHDPRLASRSAADGVASDPALAADVPWSDSFNDSIASRRLRWQTTGYPSRRDMSFEMPLTGIGSRTLSWGVWGGGDYLSFASAPESGSYDGDLTSAYLGVDARGVGWVAGLALSRSEAEVSYEFAGGPSGAGTLETELDSVYPYVQWSPHDRARMWAILGFGTGAATAVRDGEEGGDPADLSMSMGLAGLRFELGRSLGLDLAVRGDAGLLRLETGDGLAAVDDLSVSVQQVRLGIEMSRPFSLGSGAWAPFLEIGGRYDGGDGQSGGGVEVAGGLRYRGPVVGFEITGRTLATHGAEGHSEDGVSAVLQVGPSIGGRGWTFSLAPRWGGASDATDLFWRSDYRRIPGRGARRGWGLGGRWGYGFGLRERAGLVTTFGEFDLAQRDRRRMRLGVRYQVDATAWQPPLYLELSGERVEIYRGDADLRMLLTGRARL